MFKLINTLRRFFSGELSHKKMIKVAIKKGELNKTQKYALRNKTIKEFILLSM